MPTLQLKIIITFVDEEFAQIAPLVVNQSILSDRIVLKFYLEIHFVDVSRFEGFFSSYYLLLIGLFLLRGLHWCGFSFGCDAWNS